MAVGSLVASTVVMGVLLAAVVVAVARMGSPRGKSISSNRRYIPAGGGAGATSTADSLRRTVEQPAVWMLAFFVLVFGFGLAAVVFVGGFGMSVPASLGLGLVALFGVVLAVYVLVGIYHSARSRGHPSSMAAAEASGAVALLFIAVVGLKLVVG